MTDLVQDVVIEARYPEPIARPYAFWNWVEMMSEKELLTGVPGTVRSFQGHTVWTVKLTGATPEDIQLFRNAIFYEGGSTGVGSLSNPRPSPKKKAMTDIKALQAQIAALTAAIEQLSPAATPSVPLKPFDQASAEVRKAAHNAGRQAQRRVSKKAKNYTAKYKTAYDASCHKAGFQGKYETRDAR